MLQHCNAVSTLIDVAQIEGAMAGAKSLTELPRCVDTKRNLLTRVLTWGIYDECGDRGESCCAQLAELGNLAVASAEAGLFNGESEVEAWGLPSGCRKVELSNLARCQLYCFGAGQSAARAFG